MMLVKHNETYDYWVTIILVRRKAFECQYGIQVMDSTERLVFTGEGNTGKLTGS